MEASKSTSSKVGSQGATPSLKDAIFRLWAASDPHFPPMWKAEVASQQVLNCFHPTLDSDEERRDIIDYLQRLVKSNLNTEVFPYGSVPLKAYLPDGDIDMTAINVNNNESLAREVYALLQREEKNVNAEFKITDTKFIDAEVKLVKCLVRNTVVDMSFNQLGGLSTLCFLEQIDRSVGRNHLFKRSVILIKAWCYYESRILGAHHGLLSTYALETLVLHIFHLYHSYFCGPLMALYIFLEYYSEFDWENYCVSLKGAVCKLYLPDIFMKVPEDGLANLMFSEEFLDHFTNMFAVSREQPKEFVPKHLNIIDPLKENNNLGRSVSISSFFRIRSAFKYGAQKLHQILLLPLDKVSDELCKFFSNAIARHGNDNRSSIQHLALEFGDEMELPLKRGSYSKEHKLVHQMCKDMDLTSTGEPEAFNPFADLSGDYCSHIRSFLYGQLSHGFCLPDVLHSHPPLSPRTQPWDIVDQSMQHLWPQISQMTLQPVSTEQSNCTYSARGTGPYLPNACDYLPGERGVKKRDGSHEALPEKGKSQHQRRLNAKSLSPHPVRSGNQTNGGSSGLQRIEFGSVGDLAEKLKTTYAGQTQTQYRTTVMEPRRLAGQLIHLNNDAEFPPLC